MGLVVDDLGKVGLEEHTGAGGRVGRTDVALQRETRCHLLEGHTWILWY